MAETTIETVAEATTEANPDPTPALAPAPVPDRPPHPGRFYVVWSPQGGPPVVRHQTFKAARYFACKLAEKFPGQEFYVLQSCWSRKPKATEIEKGA